MSAVALRQRFSRLNTIDLHNLSSTLQSQTNDYNLTNVKVTNSFTGSAGSFNNLQVVDLVTTSPGYTVETLNNSTGGIISLNTAYSQINNYTFYATGTTVYTLATGTTNHIKYIGLNNGKNAPQQITTNQGSFLLTPNVRELAPLLYNGTVWQFFDNPIQNTARWFPTQQQGSKLVGSNGIISQQGVSVALSADGNTLAIGGNQDNNIGATWIFTRNNSVWNQQGTKLVGSGGSVSSSQGDSVSLSADGNTLAIGASQDTGGQGATWIFTRTNNVWSQQQRLYGLGSSSNSARQGASVSLSADGNTVAIGGPTDGASTQGATWIFTRTGSTWTQQGSKLVGTGISPSQQGVSVSLSADGNTLAVGGLQDNSNIGATWIFTRTNSTWSPQGSKLVGTGGSGTDIEQGTSVSLSADGNTLAVGGPFDNSTVGTTIGATWIFTRANNVWTQQGSKLVGTGYMGNVSQGISISLSSDGNTLAIGGPFDNSDKGAVWVFIRINSVWSQLNKLIATDASADSQQGTAVAYSANGNTLAIGAAGDPTLGATWIFV